MLRGAIASLGAKPYQVTRQLAGSWSAGVYTPGATATIDIVANVHPAGGRSLQSLPEGQRGNETRLVVTTSELRTRTPTTEPDRITLDGELWTCVRVEHFTGLGGEHWRAFFQREAQP